MMVNGNPPAVWCKNRSIAGEIEIGRSQRRDLRKDRPIQTTTR